MTTQKGQSRKKSARDLMNLGILLENSAEGLGPGESAAGVTYLSMRIHPKS